MNLLALMLVASFQGFLLEESNRISAKAQDWTFNLKATISEFSSRNALEQAAHECITGPSDVCVVIDPTHRWTSVHFGKSTSVRSSDYNIVSAAGNSYFKNKDWAGGVIAIGDRAMASVKQAQAAAATVNYPPVQTSTITVPKQQDEGTSPVIVFMLVLLGVAIVGSIIWALMALRKKQKKIDMDMTSFREERDEFMEANVNRILEDKPKNTTNSTASSFPTARATQISSTPVSQPVSQPVHHHTTVVHEHHHSNDNFATGLLVGQALSSPRTIEREVIVERESPRTESHRSSWGSSFSSDDDSSSSSSSNSSWDSGGGGSDWGGSDSGGGFDSGGGDSDW